MISIGKEKAIQLAESHHWEGMTYRQRAETMQEILALIPADKRIVMEL